MSDYSLTATVRKKCGKGPSYQARVKGLIPAVFYGKNLANLHLEVNPLELKKIIHSSRGLNTLIKLKVADQGDHDVLLKQYQAHAITRNFTHADFMHVDVNQAIEIKVLVRLVGRPIGIKEGGILDHIARELNVRCLPGKIPESIDVDVTALDIGDNLHLNDLKLPEGIVSAEKTNVTIAAVMAPKEEVVEVATTATSAEPEVLTAKAPDEKEEAGKDEKKGGNKEEKKAEKKSDKTAPAPKTEKK